MVRGARTGFQPFSAGLDLQMDTQFAAAVNAERILTKREENMGKVILGLVIGLILGVVGAMTLGGGAAMGVGVATGLSAGVCTTLKGAQAENLITAEQADQILNRVNSEMASLQGIETTDEIVGSAQACDEFLAQVAGSEVRFMPTRNGTLKDRPTEDLLMKRSFNLLTFPPLRSAEQPRWPCQTPMTRVSTICGRSVVRTVNPVRSKAHSSRKPARSSCCVTQGGTLWRCIAYKDGSIGEMSVVEAMDDGGGAMAGAAGSTGSQRVKFDAGSTGAELVGQLAPGASQQYVLGAKNEQFLYVRVAPRNGILGLRHSQPRWV